MDDRALQEPNSARSEDDALPGQQPGQEPAPEPGEPTETAAMPAARRRGRATRVIGSAVLLVCVAAAVLAAHGMRSAGMRRASSPLAVTPSASLPSTEPSAAASASPSASPSTAARLPNRLRLLVPATMQVPGATTSALPWPAAGQSAVAVDDLGFSAARGGSGPVPIASVAKVMTAYLILRDHPLAAGSPGPSITVLPAEAAAYPSQVAALESVVKVTPGERMTERQALQALMIASADNVAQILARWDAGGASSFTAKMNATAASLGMSSTRYTDPSGLDPGTVSTATDQVKLARRAIEVPTLAEIAAEPSAVIPVAGKIKNYNSLLGIDGVVGLKTGSDRAAGGCLLFVAREPVAGRTVTVLGAVLSQPGTRATFLPNVLSAADRLIRAVPTAIRSVPVVRAHTAIATQPGPHGVPITLGVARSVTMPGWPGAGFRLRLVAGRGHPRLQVTEIATGTVRIVQLVPLRS